MKSIKIHDKATINGNGVHTASHAKPVICIETGEVFTSATDAATHLGVHVATVSAVCLGKIRTCQGKHFCYLSSALENLDAVVTRLRETSAMEEDARKWRAQEAEREAVRLEKEKHEADVAKAKAKVEHRKAICERLDARLLEAEKRLMQAEMELKALIGNDDEEANVA